MLHGLCNVIEQAGGGQGDGGGGGVFMGLYGYGDLTSTVMMLSNVTASNNTATSGSQRLVVPCVSVVVNRDGTMLHGFHGLNVCARR